MKKNNQLTNMYSYFLCWQPAVTLLSLDQMKHVNSNRDAPLMIHFYHALLISCRLMPFELCSNFVDVQQNCWSEQK